MAAHAALLKYTFTGSTAVTRSFHFDTTTRGFGAVNLRFGGTVQTAPFSFTLNSLGPQSIAIETGPGVGVAQSTDLGSLFNGATAPAVGTSRTVDWGVWQLGGEDFLIRQRSANVSF